MFSEIGGAIKIAEGLGAIPNKRQVKHYTNQFSLGAAAGLSGFLVGGLVNAGKEGVGVRKWQMWVATAALWAVFGLTFEVKK